VKANTRWEDASKIWYQSTRCRHTCPWDISLQSVTLLTMHNSSIDCAQGGSISETQTSGHVLMFPPRGQTQEHQAALLLQAHVVLGAIRGGAKPNVVKNLGGSNMIIATYGRCNDVTLLRLIMHR
jgi:hypothetical protein